MEKEVFSDCGSWKNFHDLEDSLTLEELVELFDMAVEKQNRLMKLIAAMNGVEIEDEISYSKKGEDDWMKPINERYLIHGGDDLVGFEYGLGYQTVSKDAV